MVDAIGEAEWLEDVAYEGAHVQEPEALTYVGDLVKRVDENADSTTDTTITKVTADEGGNTDLEFNSTAPVLLLSDSHGLVFSAGKDMHSTSAGFGEWISGNLGFAIDRISRRGSGDTVRVDPPVASCKSLRMPSKSASSSTPLQRGPSPNLTAGKSYH